MNKIKFILGFLLGAILFVGIGVSASSQLSSLVSYIFDGHTKKTNVQDAIDELYKISNDQLLIKDPDQIVMDYTGVRYIGANPDNFICFDTTCTKDTMYRIIGFLFTGYTKGTGYADSTGYLMKVIKNSPVGQAAWDTSNKGYWDQGTLYNYLNNTWTPPTNYIVKAKWLLYGTASYSSAAQGTPDIFYQKERNIGNKGKLITGASAYVDAKIGLMYPSDYGFATSGEIENETYTRDYCLASAMNNWLNDYDEDEEEIPGYATYCGGNSWLFYTMGATGSGLENKGTGAYEWFITPDTEDDTEAFCKVLKGKIGGMITRRSNYYYRPVFFIDPDHVITSGSGTFTDPYKIS